MAGISLCTKAEVRWSTSRFSCAACRRFTRLWRGGSRIRESMHLLISNDLMVSSPRDYGKNLHSPIPPIPFPQFAPPIARKHQY